MSIFLCFGMNLKRFLIKNLQTAVPLYEYLRPENPLGFNNLQKWGFCVGQSTWKLGRCRMSNCHCSAPAKNSSCLLQTSLTIGSSISNPECACSFVIIISSDAVGVTRTTRCLLVCKIFAMTSLWLYFIRLSLDLAMSNESSVSSLNETTKAFGT